MDFVGYKDYARVDGGTEKQFQQRQQIGFLHPCDVQTCLGARPSYKQLKNNCMVDHKTHALLFKELSHE
jgi:hypothetical protein